VCAVVVAVDIIIIIIIIIIIYVLKFGVSQGPYVNNQYF
jgi:hypothetical protein